MIPMVDLRQQYLALRADIDAAVGEVLESTRFILGPNVTAFEQECAAYLGVAHCVGCASGTDALMLALRAAGIGPGDEVITTPFTFIATAEAVRYVGARPVFVDIEPGTFNIDVREVERAMGPATRAIMPVHIFGQPADMDAILGLCEGTGVVVIEDCAQSFGAHTGGRMTGGLGALGCFSFFPSKNLGGFGDGGLVATGSAALAERLRGLRNHGSFKPYHHDIIGYNSRLDELQAAVLRVKLRHIDDFNDRRRAVAARYNELLAGADIVTPVDAGTGHHVYHQYTILSDRRERIMAALQAQEISSAIYYPIPLHRQEVFAGQYSKLSLPVTEDVSRRCLSLPVYPELDAQDVERIARAVLAA